MSTNCPVISTQKNLKENQLHGSHDFPVDIHMDYFPVSESGEHTLYVPMHWHPEVEFHYQLQGSVRIQVELTEYVLHPGEVLWINAKQLHDCHPVESETAVSHTIIFHPAFIYGTESNILFRKYVKPLLGNPATPALYIRPEDPEQQILLDILYKCGILHQEQPETWELQILSSFHHLGTSLENESATWFYDRSRQKNIQRQKNTGYVSYLYSLSLYR